VRKNVRTAWGAKLSEKFDLTREDQADDLLFNEAVWRSVKGANSPMTARPTRRGWRSGKWGADRGAANR
jgi:hypothetical protein